MTDLGATESGNGPAQDYYLWSLANLPVGTTPAQRAAAADFDKDGQSNYSEWIALTNPANSNSRFSVPNPMASGSDLVFPFPSFTGRIYRLRQHHGGGIWTYYPTPSITGTGSTREFTIPSSAGRGIFDVEVSLP